MKRLKLDGTPRKEFNTLGRPARGGRPPKEIAEEDVRKLGQMMCTNEEVAAFFGVSKDTIENRFSAVLKEAREVGKTSLRRFQYLAAQRGNTAMLIWLGKQFLGQSEKQHIVQVTSNAPFELTDQDKQEALEIIKKKLEE